MKTALLILAAALVGCASTAPPTPARCTCVPRTNPRLACQDVCARGTTLLTVEDPGLPPDAEYRSPLEDLP